MSDGDGEKVVVVRLGKEQGRRRGKLWRMTLEMLSREGFCKGVISCKFSPIILRELSKVDCYLKCMSINDGIIFCSI